MTTLAEQDEAFCLDLSPSERIHVLEELNRIARIALGVDGQRLDRTKTFAYRRSVKPKSVSA